MDDMEKIINRKDKLLRDTGSWVLCHPVFTNWLNSESSRVLWLHGDPGKGKTMLAISLVQEMSYKINSEGSASTTALAYFFCDNKDSRLNTGTAILRGLIYQLLCQRPELCFLLRDQYEKQKDQLFNSPNSLHSLWRIFQNITKHQSLPRVFVIIDALDECDVESLEAILTLIDPDADAPPESLSVKYRSTEAVDHQPKVRWLLTSRNEIIIKQLLTGSLEISLEENHIQVDDSVSRFIGVKMDQLQRRKGYDHKLHEFVEKSLRQKAEGTFLWVALACRELSKPTVLSVNTKNVLLKLPSGILPMYGRIMEQIIGFEDEEVADYAKALLRSMAISLRPLALNELAIMANLPDEHRYNANLVREYVNICSSIVTVRDNIAYFVHLSAKTYILSACTGSIMSKDLRLDHQYLALNCFAFVCGKFGLDHFRAASLPSVDRHEIEPEYPIMFWMDHARDSPAEIANHFDLDAEFFRSGSTQREAWLEDYWVKKHAKWETKPVAFTALHLAAYAGLVPLLGKLLLRAKDSDIDISDSLGNTSLLWAAKNGHEACVILLVKMGAEVSTKNHEGMTALQWAAANGHQSIVKYLFDQGASLETKDKNGWAPLHRAAYNGHTNVVRLLAEELGADVEEIDGCTWTAMHRAATMGQIDVVRFLIGKGASTGPQDREGMTPMLHAAWAGQCEVVRIFIDAGMDVDAADFNGWTALHNAAWNGHSSTVRFLLLRKAEVNVKNSDGSTPLHHATWSGYSIVVQQLLEAGANVNAKAYDEDETPLQQAAWRGHLAAADLLLKAHADVNMRNTVGQTALHLAASNGQEEVIRLLLEYGADPFIIDKHGQSARALADANDHEDTAILLKTWEAELIAFSEGTATPVDLPMLDIAVAEALGVDPLVSTVQPHQAAGFFVPEKITTFVDGKQKLYYMKSGTNKEMFESMLLLCNKCVNAELTRMFPGEFVSLTLLHEAVPTLVPRPIVWGKFASSDDYYLVTEWIDEEAKDDGEPGIGLTLAQKIAKLHNSPAPIPKGFKNAMFGFPIRTYCGSTPQKNNWNNSWAHFYAENRLRSICRIIEENHGTDDELNELLERLCTLVVPRLLGNGRLGGKVGIKPSLIHGDLWEGNRSKGKFDSRGGIEPVTYDPACSYAHSEFELSLMRMFGGFSAGFFNEYHHLVPKTEPKKEYDDRMQLYEM